MMPGDAGRGVEVADVGLQRADGAVLAPARVAPVGLRQRRDLDRIAERRPGAVRLHHADRVGVHLGDGERLLDDRRLPSMLGAVYPTLAAPSLLTAEPLMTA